MSSQLNFGAEAQIEGLYDMARYIRAKSEISRLSPWYGDSMKKLSDEIRDVVDIVMHEHSAAPSIQKSELLSGLEERLKAFTETIISCKELVDMLDGRWIMVVIVFRAQYLKKIRMFREDVKRIGAALERGITRIKVQWPDTIRQGKNNASNDQQEQAQAAEIRDSNVPPHTIPGGTSFRITPTASFSHATVADSSFYNAGNDVRNTIMNNSSHNEGVGNRYETTVIHNLVMHFHGREQDYVG